MRNDIHIVLDSIAVAEETPLRDDPRCHVVPLLVRHGTSRKSIRRISYCYRTEG